MPKSKAATAPQTKSTRAVPASATDQINIDRNMTDSTLKPAQRRRSNRIAGSDSTSSGCTFPFQDKNSSNSALRSCNKRTLNSHSPSSTKGIPRRSKRLKGLDDNQDDKILPNAITPSPAIPQNTARPPLSNTNVGNCTHIQIEIAQESKKTAAQNQNEDQVLPPGVHSILCPHILNHRKSCTLSSAATTAVPVNVKHPCGCCFQFNDSSTVINAESYLAAYSKEYIQSLFIDELNIRHAANDFFPKHLQSSRKKGNQTSGPVQQNRRSPRLRCLNERRERTSDFFRIDHKTTTLTGNNEMSSIRSELPRKIMDARNLCQKRYEYYMDYASRKENITSYMRAVLIDWLIEVVEEYKIEPIALHTAVGLVDRCLGGCTVKKSDIWSSLVSRSDIPDPCKSSSSSSSDEDSSSDDKELVIDRKTLQLLGCGCMMIACKVHEINPPDVRDFCYISASTYDKRQIINMEAKICKLLNFHLYIITPHHFVNILLRGSHVSGNGKGRPACSVSYDDTMKYLVDYLLEIASMQYSFVKEPPSKIAAAAIFLARATLGITDATHDESSSFFSRTLAYYSGYNVGDISSLVLELHSAHTEANSGSLHAVYDKYAKEKFKMVAFQVPVDKDVLLQNL